MKKQIRFFTCLLLLKLSTIQAQQWIANTSSNALLPNRYRTYGIKVVDNNTIWATASFDQLPVAATHIIKVLRTTNGGQTWKVFDVMAAQGRISYDIQAVDSSTAWITTNYLGVDTTIGRGVFKTSDGGQTWRNTLNHRSGGVFLRFFDKNNGVAINRRYLGSTTDGGETWSRDSTPFFNVLATNERNDFMNGTNSCALKGDTVWFGTTEGRVFRSINKGRSWQPFNTGIPSSWGILSIAFNDDKNGLITALNNRDTTKDVFAGIAKTTDGGVTWQPLTNIPSTLSSLTLHSLAAVPKSKGSYIVTARNATEAYTYYTLNNGDSWQLAQPKFYIWLGAMEFISPSIGWAGVGVANNTSAPIAMYRWDSNFILSATGDLASDNTPLSISPNPSNGKFVVDWQVVENYTPQSIRVVDLVGKILYEKTGFNVGLKMQNIDLQAVANGVYILQLKSSERYISKKIVVQH
jgi:photosystem II stability/assembly factor-like uncharacterized protein